MKRFIKHIWKYCTCSLYRYHVDLYSQQQMIDRMYNEMRKAQELSLMKACDISEEDYKKMLEKAK